MDLAELEKRTAESHQKALAIFQGMIEKQPKRYVRMVCEATVAPKSSQLAEVFAGLTNAPSCKGIYGDLAEVFLLRLNNPSWDETDGNGLRSPNAWKNGLGKDEFICLSTWISRNTSVPCGFRTSRIFDVVHLDHLPGRFFAESERELGDSLFFACELIYHGIPLYERTDANTNAYTPIPETHEDYVYLSKKGQHCDSAPTGMFPFWARKYFIRQKDLEMHRTFFNSAETPTPDEVAVLRDAFRRAIGFQHSSTRSTAGEQHKTKLLSVVDLIRSQADSSFLALSGNGTWPLQKDVLEWLRASHQLSEFEAKAVDAVTRPDPMRARGKSTTKPASPEG